VRQAVAALQTCIERDIKPRDIMTMKAFENAARLVMVTGAARPTNPNAYPNPNPYPHPDPNPNPNPNPNPKPNPNPNHNPNPSQVTGGSTNATIHLIAMARSAGVDFRLEDFRRISAETPFISDLKPSGKYVMEDLHYAGGTPGVLKYMLAEGYLHGDCMTVTGRAVCVRRAALVVPWWCATAHHWPGLPGLTLPGLWLPPRSPTLSRSPRVYGLPTSRQDDRGESGRLPAAGRGASDRLDL
jgi:dihydroxy-acid dehydratase